MRAEARAEYLAKYTAEQSYQALMEIYQSVVQGRETPVEPCSVGVQAAGNAR